MKRKYGYQKLDCLIAAIEEYSNQLDLVDGRLGRELPLMPEGKLSVTKSNGRPKFCLVTSKTGKRGRSIDEGEEALFMAMLAKRIGLKTKPPLGRVQRQLDKTMKMLEKHAPELVYEKEHALVKAFAEPLFESNVSRAKRWEREPFRQCPKSEQHVHRTKKGELVRSKSEAMIADALFEAGIPYRYEPVLALKNGKRYFPDFLVLNPVTGEEFYWEHLGLMDSPEYVERNIAKLKEYEEQGILPGKNLILSFEPGPLTREEIERKIEAYLLS